MAIALALSSALSFGVSDYLAGTVSRSWDSRLVTAVNQLIGLLSAILAVLLFSGAGPAPASLAWGALSGIGSALGVLSLYRGLAVASMSVVAPLCGVLTCVIPALVGLLLGDRLTTLELVGILITVPSVGLVSLQPSAFGSGTGARAGVIEGLVAGAGFGLLFVALDRAGTHHGAWPLLPGQAVSLLLIAPFAATARTAGRPSCAVLWLTLLAGLLSGAANLLYLLATHYGELAIVGVVSSLYPAGTVLVARIRLHERWGPAQKVGMVSALVAVVLVAT